MEPELTAKPQLQEHPKLDARRKRLYGILLLFQVLNLFSSIVLIPASKQDNTALSHANAVIIDLVVVVILAFANIYFLHHFIRRRIFFFIVIILLGISMILSILIPVMDLQATQFGMYRLFMFFTTSISLFICGISFYMAVKDIFNEKLALIESLLGATNIYLLIGGAFTFIYALFNILMPGSVLANEHISEMYNVCSIYAAYTLGGVDPPLMDSIKPSVHNAMVFESLFAHLFAVFIVGRLLSKQ